MKKTALLLVLTIAVTGCGRKVDTSSPQAYTSSVDKMQDGMSDAKKQQFHDALVALAFDTADPKSGLFSSASADAPIFLAAGDKVKGKTADEIIRSGYQVRLSILDKEIQKDVSSIQAAVMARKKVASVFDNVRIDSARYFIDHSNEFMAQPIIAFHITNASKLPIKTLYAHGTLVSPGRSIPWVSADFNYAFEGGLEPGENQSLRLAPNTFGDWAGKDTFTSRTDLMLKIEVTNLEGADGQKLINEEGTDSKATQEDMADKQKLRDKLAGEMAKL